MPQSPNFPLANLSARQEVLDRVTDMFRETFPYTTIYPALGNLDLRPDPDDQTGVDARARGQHQRSRHRHDSRRQGREFFSCTLTKIHSPLTAQAR